MISAAVIVAMYTAREVLIPFAFAVVHSLIWTAPVNWLQKLRLPRVAAVLFVITVSLCAAGGIGWVIANQLIAVANDLPNYQNNIHNKLISLRSGPTSSLGHAAESIARLGNEFTGADTTEPPGQIRTTRARSTNSGRLQEPVPVHIVDVTTNNLEYLREMWCNNL